MTATLPDADVNDSRPPAVPPRGRTPRPQKPPKPPRAPRAPMAGEETALTVSTAFIMLAIVCTWVVAQLLVLGGVSQDRAQALLYDDFRQQLAGATAPTGPVVPAGDPVAVVTAEGIGLEQVVVEGTASGDTLAGPGHLRNTVLPGQAGTSVLMGRSSTYGGPFGDLDELGAGDTITVVGAQGTLDFTVLGVRRAGDPQPQPLAPGAARLTLVTSEGEGRLAALQPRDVLYVDADAAKGFPAPAGRPAAVPDSEKALAYDTGAFPLLALALALLLALTLAIVAARQRWSAALVWVIASPIAIALSWATTDVVMRLLPNVI
ncbi:sortase [Nocardioides sp. 503]|uniref:sortase n=1 Tax=Nocardioides sp. 503 TaxID=2508326 RepID=UPI00106FF294|nr:sortase [Nocardioides sp. 503]